MSPEALGEWARASAEATENVASVALGWPCRILPRGSNPPVGPRSGAFILLTAEDYAVEIGLSAEPTACMELCRALLGMSPDEVVAPDDQVADAVREFMNMVAGSMKTSMRDRAPGLQLGFPDWRDVPGASLSPHASVLELVIGTVAAELTIEYRCLSGA